MIQLTEEMWNLLQNLEENDKTYLYFTNHSAPSQFWRLSSITKTIQKLFKGNERHWKQFLREKKKKTSMQTVRVHIGQFNRNTQTSAYCSSNQLAGVQCMKPCRSLSQVDHGMAVG